MKPTKRIEFKPKDLILDNYGRVCIVIKQDGRPSHSWLMGQDDKRVRDLPADEKWYEAFPLTGGAVNVPFSLSSFIRRATKKDLAQAYESGNWFARDELSRRFGPMKMKETVVFG